MKAFYFIVIVPFLLMGCGGKGKTTCSPLFFTTSSTTVKCDKIRFSVENLPENQLMFMASGYATISEEVSQGQGEYLKALGTLLNCKDTALLAQELRSQYATIFPSEADPVNSLMGIHTLVKNTPSLQESCSLNGANVMLIEPGFLKL